MAADLAVDCALYLIAQGKNVQMVHAGGKADIGKEQSMWVRSFVIPHLYAQGVKIWNAVSSEAVADGGLEIVVAGQTKLLACDTVVECYDMVSNTDLADALAGFEVYPVGDCAKPFNIAEAIAAGNLAARKI